MRRGGRPNPGQVLAHATRQLGDRDNVLLCLTRQPKHKVKLQLPDALLRKKLRRAKDIRLVQILIDHAAHALRPSFGGDRHAAVVVAGQSLGQAWRDAIRLQGRGRQSPTRVGHLLRELSHTGHACHLRSDQPDGFAVLEAGRHRFAERFG